MDDDKISFSKALAEKVLSQITQRVDAGYEHNNEKGYAAWFDITDSLRIQMTIPDSSIGLYCPSFYMTGNVEMYNGFKWTQISCMRNIDDVVLSLVVSSVINTNDPLADLFIEEQNGNAKLDRGVYFDISSSFRIAGVSIVRNWLEKCNPEIGCILPINIPSYQYLVVDKEFIDDEWVYGLVNSVVSEKENKKLYVVAANGKVKNDKSRAYNIIRMRYDKLMSMFEETMSGPPTNLSIIDDRITEKIYHYVEGEAVNRYNKIVNPNGLVRALICNAEKYIKGYFSSKFVLPLLITGQVSSRIAPLTHGDGDHELPSIMIFGEAEDDIRRLLIGKLPDGYVQTHKEDFSSKEAIKFLQHINIIAEYKAEDETSLLYLYKDRQRLYKRIPQCISDYMDTAWA